MLEPHQEQEQPNIYPRETLLDWDVNSQFRRYLVLKQPMTSEFLSDVITVAQEFTWSHILDPYRVVINEAEGGVELIPAMPELEPFLITPSSRICYAKTAREPEHDRALVALLTEIHVLLRKHELRAGLDMYELGEIHCDDCGAHAQHRSRRMLRNDWPIADGSPCSYWEGSVFNQEYGLHELILGK